MAASGQAPAAAAADSVDPVYEWLDDGDSYLLRLNLPEFKKEDFRVHVDGEGRLTVIGQRRPAPGAGAGGEGKPTRLYKTFQLPNTANLDAISGRFDGTVLALRVPKLPHQQQQQEPAAGAAAAAPPPPPTQAKAEEAQVAGGGRKPAGAQENMAAKADRDAKPNKPVAPAPAPPSEKVATAAGGDEQDEKAARAEAEHREKVSREAARRIEAARARVAEAKAKAERERQCEHWKERVVEEGLKLADAVGRKKEAIATAVAAFTLGVFVSQKLFSRS